ncbi:glycosyltransferase family 4 protein [Flavisolibacter ginsenosidimutans]|uniref:Glycosyltransferase family 4 protein n=1 Tax=Flavisolibacter ginsenosidimutans TaxID=661481 RepID=A0A5B8UMV8_9BACT|nr:glycosyltransferase family 4 protein [Flavisolibacter ginsenosidimutans]QEC57974.1 glycosyltransferase family 4 protein [Flavisolibacter ginsenosidimutans]
MKIAILSPIAWRTPPRLYGPWEQVASNIAEGLVAKGLDVTLFATGDSVTGGKLEYTCEKPYGENSAVDVKVEECLHISHLFERAGEFDIIHNHYDFLPLTYSKLVKTPVLTTIHGFSSPLIVPVYKKYNSNSHYVSISNSNRHPELNYMATVYNGINSAEFSFVEKAKDYLLFFGRIHPEKGTREAIEVAKRCGRKLIIAGLVQDADYFNKHILPFIDDKHVVYVGNCGPAQRNELLGKAAALLHLISFEEPFGLSVAEAMCCGTPVIAFDRGSMPELIQHEQTGFVVKDEEEAVASVAQLSTINRAACREWAVKMFSKEKMTNAYLNLYEQILKA